MSSDKDDELDAMAMMVSFVLVTEILVTLARSDHLHPFAGHVEGPSAASGGQSQPPGAGVVE